MLRLWLARQPLVNAPSHHIFAANWSFNAILGVFLACFDADVVAHWARSLAWTSKFACAVAGELLFRVFALTAEGRVANLFECGLEVVEDDGVAEAFEDECKLEVVLERQCSVCFVIRRDAYLPVRINANNRAEANGRVENVDNDEDER